ncbi:MAG: hypothetical protein ACLVJ8_15380 [Ruthenibacterium lactatiformans]
MTLPPSALEFYDVARHAFVVEAAVMRCPGAAQPLFAAARRFYGAGRNGGAAARPQRRGPYGSFADNTFPDAAFAAIHTRPLPRKSPSAANTPRRRCWATCWTAARGARCTRWFVRGAAGHAFNNPAVNRRV